MRRLRRLAPLALAPLVATCAHRTAIPETDPSLVACEAFGIITYSRLHDTEDTIRQVQAHNAAYEALCGEGD